MKPVFRFHRVNHLRGFPYGEEGPTTVVVLPDLRAYRAFCVAQDARKLVDPPPDPRRN